MSKVRAIIPALGPDSVTWSRVIQRTRDHARLSLDGSQAIVSWRPGERPSWLPPGTIVCETEKDLEVLRVILAGPDWTPPEEAAIRAKSARIYTGREEAAELAALLRADPAWTPPEEAE